MPFLVLLGLTLAGGLWYAQREQLAHTVLLITMVLGLLPLAWDILQSLLRGHFGVDLIAIVAIIASLVFGQYLAGTVILLMLSGGEALESFALRRARKELTHLMENAPRFAHRQQAADLVDVPVESVQPGEVILVKTGEAIPMDGEVLEGSSMVDESALTGEALPVRKGQGSAVMSGSVVLDRVLHIRVTRPSSESKYQQIIRLIQEAERRKAPFVRLADRYSVWFTSFAFILAIAAWLLSGDPVRALAVLVVATPCPLILATPVAFASGISRAAHRGIIVRNGGALEQLGTARTVVFDKTGTLTLGMPKVREVVGFGMDAPAVLRVAASIDQFSTHVLARSLTAYAREQAVDLSAPQSFEEKIGEGVQGDMQGVTYRFGRLRYLQAAGASVPDRAHALHEQAQQSGDIAVFLADEHAVVGAIRFADEVRPDVRSLFSRLRTMGIANVRMLTGDKRSTALGIAKEIGLSPDDVHAECLPEQKVEEVVRLRATAAPVIMIGDGVNDAPAIAAADVGIAMGGHGMTASSEAGDIVIIVDRIERVGEAIAIGHRVLRIALESIFIGMGLSAVLMLIAAAGFILPVYGALLQEVIDVIVILNALRVLIGHTSTTAG